MVTYPTAVISVSVLGKLIQITAVVVPRLPYPLVIGRNFPEYHTLIQSKVTVKQRESEVETGEISLHEVFPFILPDLYAAKPEMQLYRHYLAAIFAIEEINQRNDILPNITLGYEFYNPLNSIIAALDGTMAILSGGSKSIPNYSCTQRGILVGFIGSLGFDYSSILSLLTGLYHYPQINKYLREVHFTSKSNEDIFFTRYGDVPGLYDIVNWNPSDIKTQMIPLQVGIFNFSAPARRQFVINESKIYWSSSFKTEHNSMCNEMCAPGYRKAPGKVYATCCYDCVGCSEGEISNIPDAETCKTCPDDQWPNDKRTMCILKTVEFLSFEETLGKVLTSVSIFSCIVTFTVLGIFIKHHTTPVVKANNQNLSYTLLLSLMLSFLCSLMFIGRPVEVTCLLRQAAFGIIFTVSVSSVLAKSVTVVIAFNATKPGSKINKWVGSRVSICLVFLCSLGQTMICTLWLALYPPYPDYDTQSYIGTIILQCNEGSLTAFYLVIGYIGFLSTVSFIVAFLVRNLPSSFNEAQMITFSMLVFCSVWISSIPTHLSTKGKYMVAVEIFAILASSAGLLVCIFIPKCYIILFKPELNTRVHMLSKH
ncbi:vomeronasal type-2 receptor 26-like [Bombina bombina]|uniref:vomeronasal type-2 receptor 26-like n=1 Tax=Bombina bombina TaxID=8345 RepID=UPI00235A6AB6|nr:vomeronasal type-2 receptor 26-like [Bombina bombina]